VMVIQQQEVQRHPKKRYVSQNNCSKLPLSGTNIGVECSSCNHHP
jgi:hypothetical protein